MNPNDLLAMKMRESTTKVPKYYSEVRHRFEYLVEFRNFTTHSGHYRA